jgi:hypothetical protein
MPTERRISSDSRPSGRIDIARFDSLTEEDIERMAAEDGEDEWFDPAAQPDRVSRPYEPAR